MQSFVFEWMRQVPQVRFSPGSEAKVLSSLPRSTVQQRRKTAGDRLLLPFTRSAKGVAEDSRVPKAIGA